MSYKKRNTAVADFDGYVRSITGGLAVADLNTYKPSYRITNLADAARKISAAVAMGKPIAIYADYDVDGITSGGILGSLIQYYGRKAGQMPKMQVKIPGRESDGYGLNRNYVEDLPSCGGQLITIDNGISAIDEVARAKQLGWETVILDHHLGKHDNKGNLILPQADVIVDPEAMPEGCDFAGYCGAGIALKLCQFMLSDADSAFVDSMTTLAALATVADVMPLVSENRRIVQDGLRVMNSPNSVMPAGLAALIERSDLTGHVTAEDIAFTIAPIINASSRLYDTGGQGAMNVLLASDKSYAAEYASRMIAINQNRKDLVKAAFESIQLDPLAKVNFVKVDAPGGIIGLIAGKIADANPKPTFAYTEHDGICSGSARSDDENVNNVKAMLDSCGHLFIRYGGHPGAAGFSFKKENEEKIAQALAAYPVVPHDTSSYYDLEIMPQDITAMLGQMDAAEPFGKGFPRPKFRMDCDFSNTLEYWHAMGSDGSHVRFDLPGGAKAVAFNMKDEFMRIGRPKRFTLYGDLKWNWWNGNKSPQMLVDAIER